MDPVAFPIDIPSVVASIATAGGIVLLAVFGVVIGFVLMRKLFFALVRGI